MRKGLFTFVEHDVHTFQRRRNCVSEKERERKKEREREKCLAMHFFSHSRVDRLRNQPSVVPLETARGNSQTGLGTKSNQSHTHADATLLEI